MYRFLLFFAAAASFAKTDAVTLVVQDLAGLSPSEVDQAMAEAGRVLGQAGVTVAWIRCQPGTEDPACGLPAPTSLFVRIYGSDSVTGAWKADSGAFGFALTSPAPDFGRHAGVLYGRIRKCASDTGAHPGRLAGSVIAHEVGHLLLERSRHSETGLMKGHWGKGELDLAAHGLLNFSRAEASRLKDRIRLRAGLARQR
ncbi:MAG: hypothetical protein SFV51_28565 [Bryobacteraceae bacterium]|nr:hypothetical protein [Bryobacteraceae bacterium]